MKDRPALLLLLLITTAQWRVGGAASVDVFHRLQVDSANTSYFCFRIPALVRARSGALVAFSEGRRTSCADAGDVRIVRRISTDDGATWSAIDQVKTEAGHTIGNPCPIVDMFTRHIHLLYSRDNRQVFVTRSVDGGVSWSPSVNLTSSLALQHLDSKNPFVATGPPGGIQLEGSGRLVGAMYYNSPNGTRSAAIFSDDHGATWRRGADVPVSNTPLPNASSVVYMGGESQVARDATGGPNGLVMLSRVRGDFPAPPSPSSSTPHAPRAVDHNHAIARSIDGGSTWFPAQLLHLTSSYCEGSVATVGSQVLLAAPSTTNGARDNLTLWSLDAADRAQYVSTIYAGAAAYSSLLAAQTPGALLALYERDNDPYVPKNLTLATIAVPHDATSAAVPPHTASVPVGGRPLTMGSTSSLSVDGTSPVTVGSSPSAVGYWDMDAAVAAEQLGYAEQALAFTLQGLVNKRHGPPALMLKAGSADFDWPDADVFWRAELQRGGRATFVTLPPSLCGLYDGVATASAVRGAVLYEDTLPSGAKGYTLPMALTLASQEGLLPLTEEMLTAHPCLRSLEVKVDLRVSAAPHMASRASAWRWAIDTLLQKSSKDRIFNLYHYDVRSHTDPQSNATLANVDLAIQNGAFVMDLDPDDADDLRLISEIFGTLEPLFDAYGWAHDEHAWTHAVSVAGGVVFCSFASPNLSFWARLPLPAAAGGRARKLPRADSGKTLDKSKYYVTFETNEGDTPRIVVSAFGSSWASAQRGSVPVAWSVDPVLAERFPALMDYYAATATANDSFIGGVAGAGYVYLGALTTQQLAAYATRTGRLYAAYGPNVADTYGQANFSTIAQYSAHAAAGGVAPKAYVAQPLWAHGSYAQDAWRCPELNLYSPSDGTPLICTANEPNLFYRNRQLNATDPGDDLAGRIRTAANRYEPPFFITVYGGLNWQPGSTGGKTEFWALLHATMSALGPGFVAVGADEMARLAKDACDVPGGWPNGTATCAHAAFQRDCTPDNTPWRNATKQGCEALGCCWHSAAVEPTGHKCIHPEPPAPTCLKRRQAGGGI